MVEEQAEQQGVTDLPEYFSHRQRAPFRGRLLRALAIVPFALALALCTHFAFLGGWIGPVGIVVTFFSAPLWGIVPMFVFDLWGQKLLAPTAREVLSEDPRSLALFLRSFGEETATMPVAEANYEQAIVEALDRIGPVVAVGRPYSPLPALGASRLYLGDADWQRGVRYLVGRSAVVVLQVGNSEGIEWEIELLLREMPPERLLFFSPAVQSVEERPFLQKLSKFSPEISRIVARRVHVNVKIQGQERVSEFDRSRAERREEKWKRFAARFQQMIPASLPRRLGDAVFVCFESDWTARLLELAPPAGERGSERGYSMVAGAIAPFVDRFVDPREPRREPTRAEKVWTLPRWAWYIVILLPTLVYLVWRGRL